MSIWRVVVGGTEITDERSEALRRAGMTYISGHGGPGVISRSIVARADSEDQVRADVARVLDIPESFVVEATQPLDWVYAPLAPDAVEAFRQAAGTLIDDGKVSILEQESPEVSFEATFAFPQAAPADLFAQARQLYADLSGVAGVTVPDPLELRASGFEVFLPQRRREEELLARARELHGTGDHDLAVIIAQTACEVLVADAMRPIIASHASEDLRAGVLARVTSYTLVDDPTRRLWNRLTATEIQKEPWWEGYKSHVKRRNRIAHRGDRIDSSAAQLSIEAAQSLFDFIESTLPVIRGES
jgi:hypothetical protein